MPKKLTGFPMNPPYNILALLLDSEPITSTFRSVETKPILDGDVWGPHARTGITIVPTDNLSWTLLMITILFNESDGTWSRGATAGVRQGGSHRDDPGPYIRFLFECEDTTLERRLELKVYLGN
jgi:hypothetical protein